MYRCLYLQIKVDGQKFYYGEINYVNSTSRRHANQFWQYHTLTLGTTCQACLLVSKVDLAHLGKY